MRYRSPDIQSRTPGTRTKCFWLFAVIAVSGCAAVNPKFMAPSFKPGKIDRLTVLPAVDARIDRSVDLGDDWKREIVQSGIPFWPSSRHLKRKGYDFSFAESYGAMAEIEASDLGTPPPGFIRQLGSDNERWIFVFVLEDLACTSGGFFGKSCAARCSAVLFDKAHEMAVWRHEARAEVSSGGGIGAIVGAGKAFLPRAAKACFTHELLYKQFPEKG